jgi:small subunit ribosomal protein S20
MPNTKSAKKRLRQNAVRRVRNRSTKSALRTQIRKVREAVQTGDLEKADLEYRQTARRLDQAAAGRVIHPNRAGRLKSRLQHLIRNAKQASTAA